MTVPSVIGVVNDPTQTPLAVNSSGDILTTNDGTVIIVSSTLSVRGPRASLYKRKKFWLKAPPFNVRKK